VHPASGEEFKEGGGVERIWFPGSEAIIFYPSSILPMRFMITGHNDLKVAILVMRP